MSADVRTAGDESTPIKLYGRLIKVLNLTLPEGKQLLVGENAQIIPEYDYKIKEGTSSRQEGMVKCAGELFYLTSIAHRVLYTFS